MSSVEIHNDEKGPPIMYPMPFPFDVPDKQYIMETKRKQLLLMWTIEYLEARINFKHFEFPNIETIIVNSSIKAFLNNRL